MVDAEIHFVDRGTIRADPNFAIEGHTVASIDDPSPDRGRIEAPVYNLLIEHPAGTILWDTGSHPDAGDGHWPSEIYAEFEHYDAHERDLETALGEVEYGTEDIDYVIQSHLHLDHAGGLYRFDGTNTPVFVHHEELKHAYYSAKTDEGSDAYVAADFDHDLNWQVIYGDRETHFEDIELIHLPGHTPGLMGLVIDLENDGTIVFAGDEFYLRANFEKRRPLGGGLLWDKRAWFESLRRIEELQRRYDAKVFCGHAPDDLEALRGGFS